MVRRHFPNSWLKTGISAPLVAVAVVVFLIEEVLWDGLARATARLSRWSPMARLEAAIGDLPPYAAMLLFMIPWAIILPVKLTALWLVATGHALSGALLFAGGELFGVGFLARIYVLCHPALARLRWFLRLEGWGKAASAWAHGWLNRLVLWRLVRDRLHRLAALARSRIRTGGRGWLASRLRAAHRLVRAQFQR